MGNFNPFSLEGKRIMVTGASSGIGRGIAISCSKMGAVVFLNGRNIEKLECTKRELCGDGHKIVAGDITSREDVTRIINSLPVLDGVVHCAGIGYRKICKLVEPEEVDNVMNTNFNAPILLQTALLKNKKINKGASIVFIASVAPFVPTVGNSIYSATKGAILAFANNLSVELAPRNVRVNSVCPGMIWTDLIFKGGLTEDELHEDEQKYPLRRYGTPDDVANAVIYFLSDASSWVTGTNLKVAGGITY